MLKFIEIGGGQDVSESSLEYDSKEWEGETYEFGAKSSFPGDSQNNNID